MGETRAEQGIRKVIEDSFELGKKREFSILSIIHDSENVLTKFSDLPPYRRQSGSEVLVLEELSYSMISDFQYRIDDFRVDIIEEVAVATFHLDYGGVIVNDYTFEGQTMKARSRATVILKRKGDSWVIVHKHFSKFPDSQAISKD